MSDKQRSLPLAQELHDALHNDLWLLQQAQSLDTVSEGNGADYTPPAHRYLPLLREALEKLSTAKEIAKQEIPRSLLWKLIQESRKHADSVETMAQNEPEVRRFWLVDTLLFVVDAGVRTLEREGKPAPRRLPTCRCGHNLDQHDMDYHTCMECQCDAFTSRSFLKATLSPEIEAKMAQDRQEHAAQYQKMAAKNAAAVKAAQARQDARKVHQILEKQQTEESR